MQSVGGGRWSRRQPVPKSPIRQLSTRRPGPGSYYQDVAFVHTPSKTLLLCDALLAARG